MTWLDDILDSLSHKDRWGYRLGELPAAEPLALAALALLGHDRHAEAKPLLEKLCELQAGTGALGIFQGMGDPHWGTAHAILAWSAALNSTKLDSSLRDRLQAATVRGCEFILSIEGERLQPNGDVSHNTLLVGWPWVEGTHSWLEPTALCFMALRAAGMQAHPRAYEAVRLMLDRILPAGGCNYGNTFVLGQTLRPHIQPTGIMLMALGGVDDGNERIVKSVQWLDGAIDAQTTTASLAFALLGLAANGRERAGAEKLLEAALNKPTSALGAALPRRSLAALAVLGKRSPLVTLGREGVAP